MCLSISVSTVSTVKRRDQIKSRQAQMTDGVCEMGAGKTEQALWQHRQRNAALFFLSWCCVYIQDNAKLSVIQGKFGRCQACRSHPHFVFLVNVNFHNTTQSDEDNAGQHDYEEFCIIQILKEYLITNMTLKVYFPSKQDKSRVCKQMLNQPSWLGNYSLSTCRYFCLPPQWLHGCSLFTIDINHLYLQMRDLQSPLKCIFKAFCHDFSFLVRFTQ